MNKTFLTDFPKEGVYSSSVHIFLMFVHRYFFEECSDFDTFFFVVVGKISASWWCRSKTFLNPHEVNLSVSLFNILFSYSFRKNRIMTRKFWHVFEHKRFASHMKDCCCIVHRAFYRALRKCQYINILSGWLQKSRKKAL